MKTVYDLVVIGGVAAGPKIAAKYKRACPDAKIIVFEKGPHISFSGCSLPYYTSGVIDDSEKLMSTPAGTIRTPEFFLKVKDLEFFPLHEVVKINREDQTVSVKNLSEETEFSVHFKKLAICTGSSSFVPPIEGSKLKNVFVVHDIQDAEAIKACMAAKPKGNAVIVGGGLIGIEMAENLKHSGMNVTIVEMVPQILGFLDWEIAKLVQNHVTQKGVNVMVSTAVKSLGSNEEGQVASVKTDKEEIPADLVIMAVGVRPNVQLAKDCGLEMGTTGAIKVNDQMFTNDPNIVAAGDVAEKYHRLLKRNVMIPLGSTANREGRVAALALAGHPEKFEGVIGTTICKVFDFFASATGLNERTAKAEGLDVVCAYSPGPDKLHFMPGMKPVMIKLVVDKATRKILGTQCVGMGQVAKEINTAAMAIHTGMTVDQLTMVDLAYTPPVSGPISSIQIACNIGRNKLDGLMPSLTSMQVWEMIQKKEDFLFLDMRLPDELLQAPFALPHATNLPLGKLRAKAASLPRDKLIVAFCKVSLRGYEAYNILKSMGFTNVKVMDGGVLMWPFKKLKPSEGEQQ